MVIAAEVAYAGAEIFLEVAGQSIPTNGPTRAEVVDELPPPHPTMSEPSKAPKNKRVEDFIKSLLPVHTVTRTRTINT